MTIANITMTGVHLSDCLGRRGPSVRPPQDEVSFKLDDNLVRLYVDNFEVALSYATKSEDKRALLTLIQGRHVSVHSVVIDSYNTILHGTLKSFTLPEDPPETFYQCRIPGRVGSDNEFDADGNSGFAPDHKEAASRFAKGQELAHDESFSNGWGGSATIHVRECGTGREWLVDVAIEGNGPGRYHVESDEDVYELTHYQVKPERGGLEIGYTDQTPAHAAKRYAKDQSEKVFTASAVRETCNILVTTHMIRHRVPVTRTHIGGDTYGYLSGTSESLSNE